MISGGIKSDQPCNSYEHCVTGAVILTGIGTKARTGTRFGLGPGPGPGLVWDRDRDQYQHETRTSKKKKTIKYCIGNLVFIEIAIIL